MNTQVKTVARLKLRVVNDEKNNRKVFDIGTGDVMISKALHAFLNTDEKKRQFGHYFVDGHELYYRSVCTDRGQAELRENIIAKKISGGKDIIGNSSVLPLIGRRSAWGNEVENRGETEIQRRLSPLVTMIPFSVFIEAKLDLDSFKIIVRGPEEKVTRLRNTGKWDKDNKPIIVEETVHFTGASVFSVSGKTFLFDIDRRELKHKIFNAFLVELPKPVKTIAEAYDILKPQAVKDAEAAGVEVKRQGEWFFIPVDAVTSKKLDRIAGELPKPTDRDRWGRTEDNLYRMDLRAGNNRPNTGKGMRLDAQDNVVTGRDEKNATAYFTGAVEHSGREHAKLILKGWYTAVPNTATRSFTITGDVD